MAVPAAVICEELESIINRYMIDVAWVEAMKEETAMIVHFDDGTEAYVEVTSDGD